MRIKVIGVGGAGGNTVSRLVKTAVKGVEFFAVNTDAQSLGNCLSPHKILIGKKITGGLGTGMDFKLGLKAAEESQEALKEILKEADLVFLTAGLGGGTGSSVISVLGRMCRERGILAIAVVTLPFFFEGELRRKVARWGLENLKKNIDAYLVVPNDRVLKIMPKNASVNEAFFRVDQVLVEALEGVSNFLFSSGIINVDFADLEEVLKGAGQILLGIGRAKGEQRALAAVSRALQSPLLSFSPPKAKGILFNISGRDVSLSEVNLVANFLKKLADQKTKIIFGVSEDRKMAKGEIKVTLVATSN